MTTALYRMFNADDQLLYVGITDIKVGHRFAQHEADKWWFHEVTVFTVERFTTRAEAAEAETLAIQHDLPKYNVALHPHLMVGALGPLPRGKCPVCRGEFAIRNGKVYQHRGDSRHRSTCCTGTGRPPLQESEVA